MRRIVGLYYISYVLFVTDSFLLNQDSDAVSEENGEVSLASIIRTFKESLNYTAELLKDELCFVEQEDVVFLLVTPESYRHTDTKPYNVRVGELENLSESTFSVTRPTEIFIHGWLRDGPQYLQRAADSFFEKGQLNVNLFVMDWGNCSTCQYIYSTRMVVPGLGKLTARFIEDLQQYGMDIRTLQITGHSMGSHIASFAAKSMQQKPQRIIGLDPAGPVYSISPPEERLNPDDANFVNVIYTNTEYYGTSVGSGHANWYPNGGETQPGCSSNSSCSHARSVDLYFESLYTETGFFGTLCDSYSDWINGICSNNMQEVMGFYTPENARGRYYFDTHDSPPFAMGP